MKLRNEELHTTKENMKRLADEKVSLEQKISRLEKKKVEEVFINSYILLINLLLVSQNDLIFLLVIMQMEFLEQNLEQERKMLKQRVIELEKKLEGVTRELAAAESTLAIREADLATLQNNMKELEELREMKEV